MPYSIQPFGQYPIYLFSILRKLLIYVALFFLTVLAANYYYLFSGGYRSDLKQCGAELGLTLDSLALTSDVIYFGESSNTAFKESDSSRASISGLTSQYAGRFKIGAVSKGAIHAGTYRVLMERLEKSTTVKTMIVTMNLRSFGINWIESNLETNLSRANVLYTLLPPVVKKIMLDLKAYDNKDSILRERTIKWHYKHDQLFGDEGKYKNVRTWDAAVFSNGHLNPDGTRNAEKCALACHFIKNYAFVINENNVRVKDFDAIALYCEKRKIKLILNLLPENTERAKELCGDDLLYLMNKNADYLQNRYQGKSVFINDLNLLADSCFIDREWPTEHYNFFGRDRIAKGLAKEL